MLVSTQKNVNCNKTALMQKHLCSGKFWNFSTSGPRLLGCGPPGRLLEIFLFTLRIFSGRFDTGGSMIARSVPEIHCTQICVTRTRTEELCILLVGSKEYKYSLYSFMFQYTSLISVSGLEADRKTSKCSKCTDSPLPLWRWLIKLFDCCCFKASRTSTEIVDNTHMDLIVQFNLILFIYCNLICFEVETKLGQTSTGFVDYAHIYLVL